MKRKQYFCFMCNVKSSIGINQSPKYWAVVAKRMQINAISPIGLNRVKKLAIAFLTQAKKKTK